jgi:glycosyltransferase involved in cell wall biosynthesis
MLILGRILNIPIYVHGHGVFKKKKISWTYRRMTNLLLGLSTGYIAYSSMVRDAFGTNGFDIEKVSVAENSLINPCPVYPEEKTGTEKGILFLGRLRRDCGLEVLLKVVRRLREQEHLDLELHIIGSGNEETGLKRQSQDASWVHWYGEIHDPAGIQAISKHCFVGCHPGDAGLSIVHMMSLSLPMIVHDNQYRHGPERSFIREGINGYFYEYEKSDESIFSIICKLRYDRTHLAEMQSEAWQQYRNLTNPPLELRLLHILLAGKQTAVMDRPSLSPELASIRIRES